MVFKKGNKLGKANKGKHPKHEFKKGHKRTPKGKNNPNWKGGRRKHDGYILILKPNHPNAQYDGYIFEHRLVLEKVLGRYLKPEEVGHHINGIRDDNRPENLKLFKNEREHRAHHHNLKKRRIN